MWFLISWTSFHKHDTANWIYVTLHVGNCFSWIYSTHLAIDWLLCGLAHNKFHILVGCVMFVEWSSRHQETHAKKALNLVCAWDFTSWNFWGPWFWIPTKGISSHLKVDWPCQNFNQGSTREQPRGATLQLIWTSESKSSTLTSILE